MLHERSYPEEQTALVRIISAAESVDGQPPFSDQSLVEARSGARRLLVVEQDGDSVGVAIARDADPAEFELVIDPEFRGRGLGGRAARELASRYDGTVQTWAHGDHPAAAHLAEALGWDRVRTLYQLRMPLETAPPAERFDTFDRERDADAWVRANALIFADHPEQGRVTRADLESRMAEPWFDAGDFLVVRSESGEILAYNWLKITGEVGEIYVLGVHPHAAGQGLGRRLTEAGLARMVERGCSIAALYVDGENERAVRLYRSTGFDDHTIDVQYLRRRA